MKAVTPTGEKYRVRRKWLPWRRKAKAKDIDWLDGITDIGDDPISMIILGIVLVPLIVILMIFLGEFLLLLLIFPVVMIARSIFGKPWTIEVTRKRTLVTAEKVKGWSGSRERIREIGKLIEAGAVPQIAPHVPSPSPARDR
ncbi:hypothetical protein [Flexivirga alba]|uniref:DUF983 domain-containing protein n=1 Tax=Flexivirga alba TaxID=702742 RepID=A0ABW2AEC9_9MICO